MSEVFGLSHLCVGCTGGMDVVELALVKCGYERRFVHADLPNPAAKRNLVRKWTDVHDIRLLGAQGLPSVEILHHHSGAIANSSNFQPRIHIRDAGADERRQLAEFGLILDQGKGALSGNLRVGIACVAVPESAVFWEKAMGFSVQSCEMDQAELSFRALSPSWSIDLILEKNERLAGPTFLDDLGCTCLSFLVRDVPHALEMCAGHGALAVGEPFPFKVGGKVLDVALVRGPGGELIELLQFG